MLVVVFNVILAFIIRRIVRKSILSHAKLGKSVNRVVAITTSDRVDGLKEIEKFLSSGKWKEYLFIEVMACPGGCINGGGTPRIEKKSN